MDKELTPYVYIEVVDEIQYDQTVEQIFCLHVKFIMDPELPYVHPAVVTRGADRPAGYQNERLVTIKVSPRDRSLNSIRDTSGEQVEFYDIIRIPQRHTHLVEDSVRVDIVHETRDTHGGSSCVHYPPGFG